MSDFSFNMCFATGWLVDAGRSEARRFVDFGEAQRYFSELCAERRTSPAFIVREAAIFFSSCR